MSLFDLCSGFSVIDLVEDCHSHKLYALKRITCHSKDDEKTAILEAEYMLSLNHRSLVPCHKHAVVALSNLSTAVSEVLIVMPFYKASISTMVMPICYNIDAMSIILTRDSRLSAYNMTSLFKVQNSQFCIMSTRICIHYGNTRKNKSHGSIF